MMSLIAFEYTPSVVRIDGKSDAASESRGSLLRVELRLLVFSHGVALMEAHHKARMLKCLVPRVRVSISFRCG